MARPTQLMPKIHCAPVLRLHPELGGMIADELDIHSLIKWRATCRLNYEQAVSSLRRSLLRLVEQFVPVPQIIIDILPNFRALFGGNVALAFLLCDPTFLPTALDVYCSLFQFKGLCSALLNHPTLRAYIESNDIIDTPHSHFFAHDCFQSLHIMLRNGRSIYIHRSMTVSPCSPIIRAPNTALMNYVSPYGFACVYPILTLDRKALVADINLDYLTHRDHELLNNMRQNNFDLAVSPSKWASYAIPACQKANQHLPPCWRGRFVCPEQTRMFGDRGTFLDYFDPIDGDVDKNMLSCMPPFGPMVIWKLKSTFTCEDHCSNLDSQLNSCPPSISMLLIPDPFAPFVTCDMIRSPSRRSPKQRPRRQRSQSL